MLNIDKIIKNFSETNEKFKSLKSLDQSSNISENVTFDPVKYEDTIFKDLANDIKQSQDETNRMLESFRQDYKKSGILPLWISFITLIVAILTLIVTLIK